jgi:hypothetical protein
MKLAAHQSDERMAAVPRARRVMALTFLCAFLLQSGPSAAVSRLYDAPAGVTLRDGQPCFFPPWRDPDAGREAQWIGISVTMLELLDRAMAVWSADLMGERPSTSERCIPYGVPTQGQRAVGRRCLGVYGQTLGDTEMAASHPFAESVRLNPDPPAQTSNLP